MMTFVRIGKYQFINLEYVMDADFRSPNYGRITMANGEEIEIYNEDVIRELLTWFTNISS